jgi:hypothetical protein
MRSIKCSHCGLVYGTGSAVCPNCKTSPNHLDLPLDTGRPNFLKSLMASILEHRRLVLLGIGMLVLALVLNQTQTVSSWFVPDEIAEILKILDERTADNPPEKLSEARDRVKALAIDASRGRSKAIRELVNLDYSTLGISVPNPATREREEIDNVTSAMRTPYMNGHFLTPGEIDGLRAFNSDPGISDYKNRSATMEEFVSEILVHIGEPAVDPLIDRIKAIHNLQQADNKAAGTVMPRGLLVALGKIKPPRALNLLIECASAKPYSGNNLLAVEALSFYDTDNPELIEIYDMVLTESKNPNDPGNIFTGVYPIRVANEGLARIKSEASLNVLVAHLDGAYNQNANSSYGLMAIRKFGNQAVSPVLEVARDTSAPVMARKGAIQALGLLKSDEAKSDMIAALDSPDLHAVAAEALAAWNSLDAVPDLEAAMQRHPEWSWEFQQAIQKIKR